MFGHAVYTYIFYVWECGNNYFLKCFWFENTSIYI